ncbi:hypothetical protein F0562_028523 [Nyssa sinensis]|uniref:Endoglucanase n=1 Tax=Nyssa sinensis TaxID=561372 RepID=A0A5J5AY84_9ASTE|nr:hypothetical protein F0562_028523 [Nyssa sinensis]
MVGWSTTDLTGGYYDAGDNVKFGFPMAFTTTMLAWSVIEFGDLMPPGELRNALVAIRWATDYLLKTVSQPDRIFVQVGDPIIDHNCWERPEDMDTTRTVYTVDAPNPASDVADNYRGAYSDNSDIKDGVCPFYCDFDGYQDELLWGAAWLRRASQGDSYLNYIQNNGKILGADDNINEFGWDNKHAGLNVLVSKEVLEGSMYSLQSYKASADSFMCTLIPESSSSHIEYSPGGLIYKPGGSNLQHATTITFLLLVYANYLERSSTTVNCGSITVGPMLLRQMAKRQVDYILGDNPKGISYMVGYSNYYPQRIHHRGSSLPSIKDHPQMIACKEGSIYFNSSGPNPNVLVGAVVGGPGEDDAYEDDRADFRKTEPTTYINAPFVLLFFIFLVIYENEAMAVGDEMIESSVSPRILNSVESKQIGDMFSPEDVAWADSCLIKDPETSDSNWNSPKDALLEILSSQPDSLDSSAFGRDGFSGVTGIEILPSSEEAETSQNLGRSVSDTVLINEEAEKDVDDYTIKEKTYTRRSRMDLVNGFLPNYNEDRKQIENADSGVDLGGFPIFVMEPSTDNIFRVWDLDIPAEEDELIKQLNKVLAESSLQPRPSTFDDSGVWKDLKEKSLDDLISGIADLSLNQNSG